MKVKRTVEDSVCDICRVSFNGEVHQLNEHEICSNCWGSGPTPDMLEYISDIIVGCYQCHLSLADFLHSFAALYRNSDGEPGVGSCQDLEAAKDMAMELTTQGDDLVDIFDHGKAMHAHVVVEVRFKEASRG